MPPRDVHVHVYLIWKYLHPFSLGSAGTLLGGRVWLKDLLYLQQAGVESM